MTKAKGEPQTAEKPDGKTEGKTFIGEFGKAVRAELGKGTVVGEEQKPLFGDAYEAVNTLTLERNLVELEILSTEKAIRSKQNSLDSLMGREKKLNAAISKVKKMVAEKEAKTDEEKPL